MTRAGTRTPEAAAEAAATELWATSKERLGLVLGVSARRLADLFPNGMRAACYESEGKRYNLPKAVAYMKEHVWNRKSDTPTRNLTAAEKKLEAAKTQRALEAEETARLSKQADLRNKLLTEADREIDLKTKAGEYFDRQQVHREIQRLFAYVRTRLERQASENAGVVPAEYRSLIVKEWDEANRLLCQELSQYRPGQKPESEAEAEPEPKPKKKRGRPPKKKTAKAKA